MIWLLRPDQPKPTEFAPAMGEDTGILPGLPAVAGKPVHVGFDGGRLTSDGGILLLAAIEQRLKIAERLAACIEDPRDPDRVVHEFAEMIRYRALLIAAGYPDGNDCDALKSDPAFKMAVGRLPESGEDLCSQPTMVTRQISACSFALRNAEDQKEKTSSPVQIWPLTCQIFCLSAAYWRAIRTHVTQLLVVLGEAPKTGRMEGAEPLTPSR
jgi:Transposase DDE domain group 1